MIQGETPVPVWWGGSPLFFMAKKSKYLEVGEILVSPEIITQYFACDLEVCRGACCVEGVEGAPVAEEEKAPLLETLPQVIDTIPPANVGGASSPAMRRASAAAVPSRSASQRVGSRSSTSRSPATSTQCAPGGPMPGGRSSTTTSGRPSAMRQWLGVDGRESGSTASSAQHWSVPTEPSGTAG